MLQTQLSEISNSKADFDDDDNLYAVGPYAALHDPGNLSVGNGNNDHHWVRELNRKDDIFFSSSFENPVQGSLQYLRRIVQWITFIYLFPQEAVKLSNKISL